MAPQPQPSSAPSTSAPPFTCSLHAGDVLGGRYQVRARMGMGGFACLFLGEDLVTGREVAIKAQVEREGLQHNALKIESEVLGRIQGRFAPRLLHYSAGGEQLPSTLPQGSSSSKGEEGGGGSSRKRSSSPFRRKAPPSIVMELLQGEDMSEIRHRQKSAPRLHPRVAVHLGKEMFRLLRQLHGLGFVHRDIKPNNFMRKSKADKEFWVIDFGISKQLLTSSGEMKAERPNAQFRGTTMYSPIRAHQGRDISFRDDLQSAVFVFLDLLLGKLPWFDEARAKDKARVLEMKLELVSDPRAVIEGDATLSAAPHKERFVASLAQLLAHLESLQFSDTPDYDLCLRLFDGMVAPGQENLDALPPEVFDWTGADAPPTAPTSGYQRAKQEEAGMDSATRQLLVSKQVLALCAGHHEAGSPLLGGSDPPSSASSGGGKRSGGGGSSSLGFFKGALPGSPPDGGASSGVGGGGLSIPEIDLARMWARVGRRLVEQEDERPTDPQQRLEQLGRCMAVARRHGTFFLVDGLSEREFAEIQLEAVHRVERAYSRAKKKRQKVSTNGAVVGGSSR